MMMEELLYGVLSFCVISAKTCKLTNSIGKWNRYIGIKKQDIPKTYDDAYCVYGQRRVIMQEINHLKHEVNGLWLHVCETRKYKTNAFVLKMKAPLNEKDVTMRALLPFVLQSGTKNFPTSMKLQGRLDELYGATLSVDLAKKGDYQIISFRMETANSEYLSSKEDLLESSIALLSEVLLHPYLENNVFSNDIVSKEKRSLKQRLESMFDDKMRYASMRLIEEMCEGEPYRFSSYGVESQVEAITPKHLYDYYQRCLREDEIDLYVVGDIVPETLQDLVKTYFSLPERQLNELSKVDQENLQSTVRAEPKEVFDEQDVNQGKLNIGFRTNITYRDEQYFALQMVNGIYGGFSHSKLFINVREKNSLAYYASSSLESHKGLLLVMSGIEFGNYDKAVAIIKEQMELMKKGEFTDDEIAQTKAVIKNQILETVDNANGLVEVLYHNVVAHTERPFHEWFEGIDKVTRDDLVQAAKQIELDTVYFLKGLGGSK